jgi:uncharacterized membrane protein
MMRESIKKFIDHDPHFTWRGDQVTRIENLSDIVFALSFGMLVASANVPRSFNELAFFLLSIFPVAAGFAILVDVWNSHFTFFRRYGLVDRTVLFLNGLLIFSILFLAYPLRFSFESLFGFVLSSLGIFKPGMAIPVSFEQSGLILGMFGVGYAIVMLIVASLYMHALSRKSDLKLAASEVTLTRRSVAIHTGVAVTALVMAGVAFFSPLNGFAGTIMVLTWPLVITMHVLFNPNRKKKVDAAPQ